MTANNSMDVRAKQRLCYRVVRQTQTGLVAVSPHVISTVRRFVVNLRFVKTTFIIFAFVFYLFATSSSAFGQICVEFPCVVDSSDSGEVASAAIDNFLVEAARSGERLFVIARLGTGETDSGRNLDRLCEARDYIVPRLPKTPELVPSGEYRQSPPTIFAEGERVEGEGQIEFYLGSKLHLTRIIRRNRSANLNCCEDITPAKAKRKRKECKEWKDKGASNRS